MTRAGSVALLALALLATGCGGDDSDGAGAAAPDPATTGTDTRLPEQVIDPCTVLTDADLTALGVRPDTKADVAELDLRGCGWLGDRFGFDLTTNPDSVQVYRGRADDPVFLQFRETTIAGRTAVEFVLSQNRSDCCIRVDAGTGSVGALVVTSTKVTAFDPTADLDDCAFARQVMELIATRLPAR